MPRITPQALVLFTQALLAGLDGRDGEYWPLLDELRSVNEVRALALEDLLPRLLGATIGERDHWLARQARVFAPLYPEFAHMLAQRIDIDSRRAELLDELGDAEGAQAAREAAEATLARAKERRVFVDPRTERDARKAQREAARATREAEEQARRPKGGQETAEPLPLDMAA